MLNQAQCEALLLSYDRIAMFNYDFDKRKYVHSRPATDHLVDNQRTTIHDSIKWRQPGQTTITSRPICTVSRACQLSHISGCIVTRAQMGAHRRVILLTKVKVTVKAKTHFGVATVKCCSST